MYERKGVPARAWLKKTIEKLQKLLIYFLKRGEEWRADLRC